MSETKGSGGVYNNNPMSKATFDSVSVTNIQGKKDDNNE